MPTAPTRRRMARRKMRNRNQYIAVPRTMSSSGAERPKSSDQSGGMVRQGTC